MAESHCSPDSIVIDNENYFYMETTMPSLHLTPPIPIFRVEPAGSALEFYCGFMGMTLDWEHQYEPGFPYYRQVSRGPLVLHLSEHTGDTVQGARVYLFCRGLETLLAELSGRDFPFSTPASRATTLEDMPWGRELRICDPFNNIITFCERPEDRTP